MGVARDGTRRCPTEGDLPARARGNAARGGQWARLRGGIDPAVSVTEIERTAREGLLMPPKSTFFTPKLKTGFVLRSLSE